MEDQLTLFEKIRTDLVDQEELVSTGKMMSTEAIKYDRSVFAFISKSGNMVFKFGKDFNPDEQDYEVIPFNPFKNKGPLTGWYEVPYTHSDLWEFLTKEALIKIKQN